jgi:hypothetical protein
MTPNDRPLKTHQKRPTIAYRSATVLRDHRAKQIDPEPNKGHNG